MKKGIQKGDVKVGDVIRFTHSGIKGVMLIGKILDTEYHPNLAIRVTGVDKGFNSSLAEVFNEVFQDGVILAGDHAVMEFYSVDKPHYKWQLFKEDQLGLFNETD